MRLGLVGHQPGEQIPQPDRLGREVPAGAVALVEDEVDHREHRCEALGQRVVGRDAEGDPRLPDLGLGPGSRRFIVSAATRNASAISSVVRPPRARKVRATRASVASAGWQQVKMSSSRSSGIVVSSIRSSTASGTSSNRVLAARVRSRRSRSIAWLRAVVTATRPDSPGAIAWPALGRDGERLLGGLLGEIEVAEEADQGGQHPAPLVAEDLLDQGYGPTMGRTSTDPPRRAAGIRPRARGRRRGRRPRAGRSRRRPPWCRRTGRR